MDVTKERISHILELREILLSFQTGFSLVNAAVVCAILESISGLEPSSTYSLFFNKEREGFWHDEHLNLSSIWTDPTLNLLGPPIPSTHRFFCLTWSTRLGSAPLCRRSLRVSLSPHAAATCNGVDPSTDLHTRHTQSLSATDPHIFIRTKQQQNRVDKQNYRPQISVCVRVCTCLCAYVWVGV